MRSEGGVEVYRKLIDANSQYACVKSYGEVKASPEKIFQLLCDMSRCVSCC